MKPSRSFLAALLVLGILAVWLWLSFRARTNALDGRIAAEIRTVLHGPRPRARPTEAATGALWEEVRKFYKGRGDRPAWCDGAAVRPEAVQLLGILGDMDRGGIEPARYDHRDLDSAATRFRANALQSDPPLVDLARWDVRMTRAFLLASEDLLDGRIPRSSLDPDWLKEPGHHDPAGLLEDALRHHRVRETLAGLAPRRPEYLRLRDALAGYRAILGAGGWPLFRGGDMRQGARGEAVETLRRRLAATGDLPSADGDLYDRDVERAVRRFQSRHGLDPTGRVDAPTRVALNVTVERRIRQIELNLERWRWLPDTLGEPDVEVNIPDFTLAVHDSGRITMAMRVVVGGLEKQTPVFSDEIAYLELNPSWRLSKRILVNEILPQLEMDPDYLNKQHMTVCYFGGKDTLMVDASAVDWSRAREEDFKYLVAQEPGPENPLGRIKIMCPNEYDVYLHDTPARHLFNVRRRALSHGCVRLEQPVELARYLLGEQMERDSLDAFIGLGTWRRVGLKKHVPVHFLYWTAWADSQGVVNFRDDLYGLDRRLDRALRGDSLATFRVNPPEPDSLRYP